MVEKESHLTLNKCCYPTQAPALFTLNVAPERTQDFAQGQAEQHYKRARGSVIRETLDKGSGLKTVA